MPGVSVVPMLADVPIPPSPQGGGEAKRDAAATEKEADSLVDSASGQWVNAAEVPALLTRAAKLLRHAEALVKSPMCSGK